MNVLTIAAGGFFIMRGEMDLVDLVTFSLYIFHIPHPGAQAGRLCGAVS